MPDPERLVSRSVSLLSRLGMTEDQALAIVLVAARNTAAQLVGLGVADVSWVLAVIRIAQAKGSVSAPSETDT